MSFFESKVKGEIPVGKDVGVGGAGIGKIAPGPDGTVLTSDSSSATGWNASTPSSNVRDIFRYSMLHQVGG